MRDRYIQYDPSTGEILASVTMSKTNYSYFKEDQSFLGPNLRYMEITGSPNYTNHDSMDTNYYLDITSSPPVITEKSVLGVSLDKDEIIADGVDECLFTNIPAGTNVIINGPSLIDSFVVNDGQLDFSSITPGWYDFNFSLDFKYSVETFRVLAV